MDAVIPSEAAKRRSRGTPAFPLDSPMKDIAIALLAAAALLPTCASGQVCAKHIEVPEYPPIALAAASKGNIDLTVTIGAHGQVVKVDGAGPVPMLIDYAMRNVRDWVFCTPKEAIPTLCSCVLTIA